MKVASMSADQERGGAFPGAASLGGASTGASPLTRHEEDDWNSLPLAGGPGEAWNVEASAAPVVVLKFGHSVLQSVEHVPVACSEIYRHLREGKKVVAVVSAIGNETSELLRTGGDLFEGHGHPALPKLLRIGEFRSSAIISLALSRIGVHAHMVDPHEIDLAAEGDPLDADLTSVDRGRIEALLATYDVLVVPGFVAHDAEGHLVALGRGGTDLTAVFLADALEAERLILLKDVPGVFTGDPNAVGKSGDVPARYVSVDWDQAAEVGGGIVQDKALYAAKKFGRTVEVSAVGESRWTRVGPHKTRIEPASAPAKLRVALAGLGNVGGGLYQHLRHYPERFEIVKVLVRDPARHAEAVDDPSLLTADAAEFEACGADVLVELMGGTGLAGDLVERALARGVHVVSANKALVAERLAALREAGAAGGAELRYSAAVGGGVPLLEAIDRLRAGGEIRRVEAVVNGTCNYVLGLLGSGENFEAAVRSAQENGFAEADPSADVDGHDAAQKLAIIADHAFGADCSAEAMERESLAALSAADVAKVRERGKVIKQVSCCEVGEDGVRASVRLKALDPDHFLAGARAEQNRALVTLGSGAVVRLGGKGAGRWPTAEAVLADLFDVWRARAG